MAENGGPSTDNPTGTTTGVPSSTFPVAAVPSAIRGFEALLKSSAQPDKTKQNVLVPPDVAAGAINSSLLALNNALLPKAYRWYSTTTPGYAANSGPVLLSDLAARPTLFRLDAPITVEFGPEGNNKTYVLKYDSATPPQYTVSREYGGPTIGAKLVLMDSEEADAAGIELVDEMADQYLTAKPNATPPVPADFAQYVFDSGVGAEFVTPKQDLIRTAFNPPLIPLPTTGGDDDPNWRKVAKLPPTAPPAGPTEQVITAADIQFFVESGLLNTSYLPVRITDRVGPGGVDRPDVLTRALSAFTLDPRATLDPQASADVPVPGAYNIANDDFTADAVGYVRLTGAPANQNLLIGPFDADNSITGGNNNTIVNGIFHLIGGGTRNIIVGGDGNTIAGGSSNAIQGGGGCVIPATCNGVQLINCSGFTVPDGVSGKTYINNIEFTGGGGGGPSVPVRDVYDVSEAIREAVIAGAFTSGELQGTQPTGSASGMKFTTTTYGYEYQRGAAGSLVWCRYVKG